MDLSNIEFIQKTNQQLKKKFNLQKVRYMDYYQIFIKIFFTLQMVWS